MIQLTGKQKEAANYAVQAIRVSRLGNVTDGVYICGANQWGRRDIDIMADVSGDVRRRDVQFLESDVQHPGGDMPQVNLKVRKNVCPHKAWVQIWPYGLK